MITPREATVAPREGSRSPLSPTEVTESATVRLFLILSAFLCSVNNADLKTATWLLYCLRLRSRSPHNAQHSTESALIFAPASDIGIESVQLNQSPLHGMLLLQTNNTLLLHLQGR